MIQKVLVLGAGSAGLLAAITLKRKIPKLDVTIVRSPDIGVIGVGEGTTPNFPVHLFDYLGISRRFFYSTAEPTWKIGVGLQWGPRGQIQYGFGKQLDAQWNDLPRPHGFYCDDDFRDADLISALMARNKVALPRAKWGGPDLLSFHAFHIENKRFIETMKIVARTEKIEIIDGKVEGVRKGPEGIAAIVLTDGRALEADLFVDCSGFRSELLGRALEEPYISFSNSLFCDRACVAGWDRVDEPIMPYTLAETMDAGWCWRIDHEHIINRGYVYSSGAISDDVAREEFLRKNPRAKDPWMVKFRSGCYQRTWVGQCGRHW
jgi:tryptophan 7-halogenase